MARPHVALYVPALRLGGAQHVSVNIVNALARRGYPVDLVVSYNRGGFRDEVYGSVTVVDLETPELPGIGIGASVPALRRYLDRTEPPILFSVMTFANVVALTAGRLADTETRIVPTEHDEFDAGGGLKSRLVSRIASRLYPSATHVLGVSGGVADSVVRHTEVAAADVSVMFNPIEVGEIQDQALATPEHRWARDPDVDLVFTVGRLEDQKDLPTLLDAFETVSKRRPSARLLIAGQGSKAKDLERRVARLGLEDVVDLPGYVDNPYALMSNADVFALSSRHEGLPTVLIEALACGCPIVSTDCPSGPDEILGGGTYGRLVPVGDSDAFAERLLDTLDDPPASARLRERASDFSTETVIDEYVEFIDEHVGEPDATASARTSIR